MTKTLMELMRDAGRIEEMLIESAGEFTDEISQEMAKHEIDLMQKVDAYGFVISDLSARRDYAMQRMKEWESVVRRCESAQESIENRLRLIFTEMNCNALNGREFQLRLQTNPPGVDVFNPESIPGEFITTEMRTSINKRAILEALKAGQDVPGAVMKQGTRIALKTTKRSIEGGNQ